MLQKQKDTMNSGPPSQTVISLVELVEIGKELTGLCDKFECYGLVDYQCGVWEERIVDSMWSLRT